jgi:hypothetical protein
VGRSGGLFHTRQLDDWNKPMKSIVMDKNDERGVAAAEFALILPVLMLLVFGIYHLGQLAAAQITLNDAARVGLRYYMICYKNPSVNGCVPENALVDSTTFYTQQYVATLQPNGIANPITITITPYTPKLHEMVYMEITATVPISYFNITMLPSNFELKGHAEFAY